MHKGNIQYILFDAANTLIHKPVIWEKMMQVLRAHGHEITLQLLQNNHKLLSEVIMFPDRTSSTFYRTFNAELLYSLGIVPEESLLDDLFAACTYQPWAKFDDMAFLTDVNLPMGIVSNFSTQLRSIIEPLYGNIFTDFLVSEELGIRKPDVAFYRKAQETIGIAPNRILYIGDSLKLDVQPALSLGWNALLIDRAGVYPNCNCRIGRMSELQEYL